MLHREIAQLKRRLREAEEELEMVQQHIDAHSNLILSLRRMPSELLRDIFEAASPSAITLVGLRDMTLIAPWT